MPVSASGLTTGDGFLSMSKKWTISSALICAPVSWIRSVMKELMSTRNLQCMRLPDSFDRVSIAWTRLSHSVAWNVNVEKRVVIVRKRVWSDV